MLKTFLLLLIVTFSEDIIEARALIGDTTITFDRTEEGLPWPLPDINDPGKLVEHGVHCFQYLLNAHQTTNETENVHQMHIQHCSNVTREIVHVFQENPSFKIDDLVCESLNGNRFRRNRFGSYLYNFRRRRSITESVVQKMKQTDVYVGLVARNYGTLLMKMWDGSLNDLEAAYLQKFFTPRAIRLGAMGVYCNVKGDIEFVKTTLNNAEGYII